MVKEDFNEHFFNLIYFDVLKYNLIVPPFMVIVDNSKMWIIIKFIIARQAKN
jgi:hypothetical protein